MIEACAVDGCVRVAEARGWCKPHYHRWARYGSPEGSAAPKFTDGRRREVAEYARAEGTHAAALKYDVSVSTVGRWRRQFGLGGRERPRGTRSAHEAAAAAGVSYRQLDHWNREGIVCPAVGPHGSGSARRYSDDDVEALRVVGRLVGLGMDPRALKEYERVQRAAMLTALRQVIADKFTWGPDDVLETS